jgi:hypothetical protein
MMTYGITLPNIKVFTDGETEIVVDLSEFLNSVPMFGQDKTWQAFSFGTSKLTNASDSSADILVNNATAVGHVVTFILQSAAGIGISYTFEMGEAHFNLVA